MSIDDAPPKLMPICDAVAERVRLAGGCAALRGMTFSVAVVSTSKAMANFGFMVNACMHVLWGTLILALQRVPSG